MIDELKEAYTAYQRALYSSEAAKDSGLWYAIGILYDKCGSRDLAEEVFCHVLKIAPDFERKNEVLFRLGMIYKHEEKYAEALECFNNLLNEPPTPLTKSDILFQIGIVHELKGNADKAKQMYEKVLEDNPNHAKVITQLGWLFHQEGTSFYDVDKAIELIKMSVQADPRDPQPWYLLGRCYMTHKDYKGAYSAYQQAVCRDEMNPSYWCSIGVLYYQINQFRDALDAYSRSICLNPAQSEVWYDLGTLYESCRQLSDAYDAYNKAADLDPNNPRIVERLNGLRAAMKLEEGDGGGNGGNGMSLPQAQPVLKQPSMSMAHNFDTLRNGGAGQFLNFQAGNGTGNGNGPTLARLEVGNSAAALPASATLARPPHSDAASKVPVKTSEGVKESVVEKTAADDASDDGGMEIDEGDEEEDEAV